MLSIAEAAKAIGVTRLQLYNVINGRREMAACFEKASGGSADLWLRTHAARDLTKVPEPREDHRAPSRAAGFMGVTLGRRSLTRSPIARRSARERLSRHAKAL